jgi:hypothetical protein
LFSKPPLLSHEDRALYFEFARKLVDAVGPRDEVERLWVKDFVDLSWEIYRFRRLKSALLDAGRPRALKRLLINLVDQNPLERVHQAATLAQKWFEDESRREVEQVLARNGLDAESVIAQCFAAVRAEIETIERMLAGFEARRNKALHELERWRANLGRRPQDGIIDLEPSIVPEE